jgi:hypothetical protein
MSSLPPPTPAAAPGPESAERLGASAGASAGTPAGTPVDLDRIAQDLIDVEVALERLDQGTYWTCEVTGEPLPDDLLAADPVARRRPVAEAPPRPDEDPGTVAPASPGSTPATS